MYSAIYSSVYSKQDVIYTTAKVLKRKQTLVQECIIDRSSTNESTPAGISGVMGDREIGAVGFIIIQHSQTFS
jgi:hypothetical protein